MHSIVLHRDIDGRLHNEIVFFLRVCTSVSEVEQEFVSALDVVHEFLTLSPRISELRDKSRSLSMSVWGGDERIDLDSLILCSYLLHQLSHCSECIDKALFLSLSPRFIHCVGKNFECVHCLEILVVHFLEIFLIDFRQIPVEIRCSQDHLSISFGIHDFLLLFDVV